MQQNQDCQEKIEHKYNKKIKVAKKTIKHSYNKNQGCLEKKVLKLNKGIKNQIFLEKN